MKRSSVMLAALCVCAGVLLSCGGGGGGNSTNGNITPDPVITAIDISHDGTSGLAFGRNALDQLRRYQTFVADSRPTITGVEIKIRKNSATDNYSSLSLELYKTDAAHQPATLLAMTSLSSVPVTTAFSTIMTPFSYYGLVPGTEYAIVLEQYNAFGANEGFEWCAKQVSTDYFFGKYDSGLWGDESILGDGWLRVYVDSSPGTNPEPGSLDASFGTGGTTTVSFGTSYPYPGSAAVQSDEKIVVALTDVMSEAGFMLARFNADGSLDTTFNGTGMVTTPVGTMSMSNSVVIQPDGKIVTAGLSFDGSISSFGLARYTRSGALDPAFNTTGIVTAAVGTNSYAVAVTLQPDGKIVALGDATIGFGLARFTSSGILDTTFNSSGTATVPFSYSNAHALAIQPDGKIISAGTFSSSFTLVRHTASGSLDTTFNSTGVVLTDLGMFSQASAIAIQPDGKILAAGTSSSGMDTIFTIVRYTSSGSLDTSFGSAGIVSVPTGSSSSANALALQPDGKIVAAGSTSNGSSWSMVLRRFTSSGSLDTTFGSSGLITLSLGANNYASAAAIAPDGKIVLVGTSDGFTAAARYHH